MACYWLLVRHNKNVGRVQFVFAHVCLVMEVVMSFLDKNQRVSIEVLWVPGHMGIEGNNRADELAKEVTELEPATETTTIAKLHWQLCAKMKTEWTIEWARKPIAGRYAISDCIPPLLAGSHTFRTLDQHILGIVTQARTRHGYFGKYYQTQNIQEPNDCPCGAGLQMCEHIVFECWMHKEYGDIIDEGAPDHQLATLFGTKKGIDALAEFIRKTKAFQKT